MIEEDNYPKLYADRFTCPFCGLYTEQTWQILLVHRDFTLALSMCKHCDRYLLWRNDVIIDPYINARQSIHHMAPNITKTYYERAMIATSYDLASAYAYLKYAFYLLLVDYLGGNPDSILESVEVWKKEGMGSFVLWHKIEEFGFLRNFTNTITVEATVKYDLEQIQDGLNLFNECIEEIIVNPEHLIQFFSHQADDSEEKKKVDPHFFER